MIFFDIFLHATVVCVCSIWSPPVLYKHIDVHVLYDIKYFPIVSSLLGTVCSVFLRYTLQSFLLISSFSYGIPFFENALANRVSFHTTRATGFRPLRRWLWKLVLFTHAFLYYFIYISVAKKQKKNSQVDKPDTWRCTARLSWWVNLFRWMPLPPVTLKDGSFRVADMFVYVSPEAKNGDAFHLQGIGSAWNATRFPATRVGLGRYRLGVFVLLWRSRTVRQ